MNILVANIGSTSFKYRLFRFASTNASGSNRGVEEATLLAKGGFERVTDYGQAIDSCLDELKTAGHLKTATDLAGVGFKTVLGKNLTGCVPADEKAEAALLAATGLAPAHNPPYAAGIHRFREKFPALPLVALFETAFYQWIPEPATRYAVPQAWHDAGVRRYGFHGASHKYVAERSAELLDRADIADNARNLYVRGPSPLSDATVPLRVISCHLGGSSSITGILNGVAIGTSMGLSPQSGLPQNNRVGDLDSAAIPYVHKQLGLSIADIEKQLTKESGLLALSGVSNDVRDIRAAAQKGDARARLAIDVFVHSIRHWIGAFWLQLGGCDALVFTAGIGENNAWLREQVCAGLSSLGLTLDPARNASAPVEHNLATPDSRTQILVIPANEELVVARETHRLLSTKARPSSSTS
ncbi:acetate kinase [Opitutaceae bacterium TAV4]|nr:acetate kinase [Opitutaceae bacterium TAV4]RRJ99023.1 acetate kinase [Opitutaceae bacterium TAV3]RRJ99584.1 acetate kinase [Opitutaceae bacterium TAV3]